MFLQKRKNIQGDSPFLKTAHIPFDKLTDLFMLSKAVYHRTSLVGFGDKVAYNMSVCAQSQRNKSRLLYATNREKEKQTIAIPPKRNSGVYQYFF